MKKIIKYFWKLLTDINERGIYNRDESDINLLKGKKNSEYLLISRQSARLTFLSAIAFLISTLAIIISTCALIVTFRSNSAKGNRDIHLRYQQGVFRYR